MQPTMYKIMYCIISFVILEFVAIFLFKWIRKTFSNTENNTKQKANWSVLKGLLERGMLLLAFIAAVPTVIVFFGAIKLGTRFKETEETKISNDYFLVGNITSAIVVLLEYFLYQLLSK